MTVAVSTSLLRSCVAATLSVALIAAESPTYAQPPVPPTQQSDEERAAARAAANAGVELLEQGRYAEALDRLQRAEALVHSPTHLLYIARVQTKMGQLVEASETYVKITREVLSPDAPRAFVEAQTTAAQEGKDLDARIPTLLVRVDGPADAVVTMDGAVLPAPVIGMAAPVNPGVHALRAASKDGASAETRVKLTLGAHETVVLVLRPPPPAPAPPPPERRYDVPRAPAHVATERGSGVGQVLGYAALGLGLAGLAVGTTFLVINRSKRTDANDLCAGGVCPIADKPQIQSLDQQADSAATLAWVGYGVGGAALATGLVLLFTSGSAKKNDATGGPYPWIGAGVGGVTGRF
jgi:hypothetical protein